jgi:catechol 2,3-dioxygenase-like lactoylglutathione lyase family enzyme
MDDNELQNAGLMPQEGDTIAAFARLPTFDKPVIRPAILAHVVLSTNNVDRISNWYATVLGAESTFGVKGLRAVDADGKLHKIQNDFLTFDKEHHRVAFMKIGDGPDDPPPQRTLNHVAYTYANLGDLVGTYVRLKGEGILPFRTVHHGPTVSNYYLDPDGNRVELQIDVFPSVELLNDWFQTGAFNKNPIGRPFDFQELADRFAAGDDLAYLISNDGFIEEYSSRVSAS